MRCICRRGAARLLIGIASVLIVAVTVPPYWGRSRVLRGLYRCRHALDRPDSLVLAMTGQPLAYVIPFLPPACAHRAEQLPIRDSTIGCSATWRR
jgi:hypothetical protein